MSELELTPQGTDDSKDTEGEDQEIDLIGKKGENSEGTSGEDTEESASGEKGEGEGEGVEEVAPNVEEILAARDSEIQELRQLLRENKRAMTALKTRVDGSDAALDKAGLLSDEDKAATLEQQKALAVRERELDTILEMTRLNPKYEDVDKVVSQSNFDDMVEAMSKEYATNNRVSNSEAIAAVEGWIWSMTNPYRYMYDLIKKNHPSFASTVTKKPAEAPSSIQGISGGTGAGSVGWTAAKIDNLPEDELSKVPADIYAKYLRNDLK
jgi:hypothetical protein